MGTFTWSYFIRSSVKAYSHYIIASPLVLYLGYFYWESCCRKRSMMKGQSKLYAERRAEIQAWADKTGQEIDIWRY